MVKKIITVNANSTKTLNIKDLKVGAAKLSVTNLNSNGDSVEDKVADVIGEMKTPTDAVIENGTATFNALDPTALDALSVSIDYVQEGTGTPSPDNVRTITGWDAAEITVSDGTNETEYNISFGTAGTVYKGTLNVLTGELTVAWVYDNAGNYTWNSGGSSLPDVYLVTSANMSNKAAGITNIACDMYDTINAETASEMTDNTIKGNAGISSIYVKTATGAFADISAFRAHTANFNICYELATPLTYQLTPTQVYALVGSNTVSADCGSITECVYTQIATANNLNYSLSEVNTGKKWIDGKDIYTKTINGFTPINASTETIVAYIDELSFDTFISIEGVITINSSKWTPFNSGSVIINLDPTKLLMSVGADLLSKPFVATITYTKTE